VTARRRWTKVSKYANCESLIAGSGGCRVGEESAGVFGKVRIGNMIEWASGSEGTEP